jgi:hypothetical protein
VQDDHQACGNDNEALEEVTLAIKCEVVKLTLAGDRSRAAFDFALHNESDTVVDGVRLLPSLLFDKSHWVWATTMPQDRSVIWRLIGHNHSGIQCIEKKPNCTIVLVKTRTREEHILVTGKRALDVAEGRRILLRKIREFKKAYKKYFLLDVRRLSRPCAFIGIANSTDWYAHRKWRSPPSR